MNKKRKNLRKGFIRLTLVLSIIIGAPVGCFIGLVIAETNNPFITGRPTPYLLYGFQGLLLGFASVWLLYFFITHVIIPVIRFVKSGFEQSGKYLSVEKFGIFIVSLLLGGLLTSIIVSWVVFKNVNPNVFIPVIAAVLTAGVSLLIWFMNEHSKRAYENYKRREERYMKLIDNMRGFYESSRRAEKGDEFLKQLNLCWLYCPDDIIKKGYAFTDTIHTGATPEQRKNKEKSFGEFILAIRKDLLSRQPLKATMFKAENFQHLKVTEVLDKK